MLPFVLGLRRVENGHTDICTSFFVASDVRSFDITQKLIKVNIKQPYCRRMTTRISSYNTYKQSQAWECHGPNVGTCWSQCGNINEQYNLLEVIYSPIRVAYCEITCLCQTASHLGKKNKASLTSSKTFFFSSAIYLASFCLYLHCF